MKPNKGDTQAIDQFWGEVTERLSVAALAFLARNEIKKALPENHTSAQAMEFKIPQPPAPKMQEKAIAPQMNQPKLPTAPKAPKKPNPLKGFMKSIQDRKLGAK